MTRAVAWLRTHKHVVLLGVLVAALVTQPLVAHESAAGRLGYDLLVAAAALLVLQVVFSFGWERKVAIAAAVPAVALTLARYLLPDGPVVPYFAAYHVSVALFLAFTFAVMARDLLRGREASLDAVVGAFAAYLLLGVAWGALYAAAELLFPGAFSVAAEIRWQLDDWHLRRALFNYVSFATMASLGYNDVTAVAPIANTLMWLEVLTAQFYLAVVIAQIVGLKLAQTVAADRQREADRR
jgi:hypothetical protein